MKLTDSQYNRLTYLLSTAKLVDQVEYEQRKKSVPGVINAHWFAKGEHAAKHYSLQNIELVRFLAELAGDPSGELTTIHQGRYEQGSKNVEHIDHATWTMVIMLDANLIKGGEFYLNGEVVPDFRAKGDYITYNGSVERHRVELIEEGFREVLVVWWLDKNILKKQKQAVNSLV
jgi:hypothetical protein